MDVKESKLLKSYAIKSLPFIILYWNEYMRLSFLFYKTWAGKYSNVFHITALIW